MICKVNCELSLSKGLVSLSKGFGKQVSLWILKKTEFLDQVRKLNLENLFFKHVFLITSEKAPEN